VFPLRRRSHVLVRLEDVGRLMTRMPLLLRFSPQREPESHLSSEIIIQPFLVVNLLPSRFTIFDGMGKKRFNKALNWSKEEDSRSPTSKAQPRPRAARRRRPTRDEHGCSSGTFFIPQPEPESRVSPEIVVEPFLVDAMGNRRTVFVRGPLKRRPNRSCSREIDYRAVATSAKASMTILPTTTAGCRP
jgi:hypothetical protein